MRKVGIEFPAGIGFDPDLTGLEDTLSLKYKLEGTTEWTNVEGSFVGVNGDDGAYTINVTINVDGIYLFVFESTDVRLPNKEVVVTISKASIDDVKTVVDDLAATLALVKGQVDTLDEETVNGISAKVDSVGAQLVELKGLLSDTDDDAVVSLRELLTAITDAGSDRDGVLAALTGYTDGVESRLDGLTYVDAEGNTVAAEDSFGLKDIYNAITGGADGDSVADKIDAVKAVVDANKTYLEDSGYGLSALKTLIDNVQASIDSKDTDNDDVLAVLNDGTTGIVALRDSLMTKLDSMDAKLDSIQVSTIARVFI